MKITSQRMENNTVYLKELARVNEAVGNYQDDT